VGDDGRLTGCRFFFFSSSLGCMRDGEERNWSTLIAISIYDLLIVPACEMFAKVVSFTVECSSHLSPGECNC